MTYKGLYAIKQRTVLIVKIISISSYSVYLNNSNSANSF